MGRDPKYSDVHIRLIWDHVCHRPFKLPGGTCGALALISLPGAVTLVQVGFALAGGVSVASLPAWSRHCYCCLVNSCHRCSAFKLPPLTAALGGAG